MTINLLQHPLPYENESLASYINRLASANCCDVKWIWHFFEQKVEKTAQIRNDLTLKQINSLKNDKVLSAIAKTLNLNKRDIKKMTINSLMCHFSKTYSKFCPQCLKENHYHRKYWQSDLATVCIKHGSILQEFCIKCGKKIEIDDVITGVCSCGAYLADSEIFLCNEHYAFQCQKRIYEALKISFYEDIVSIRSIPRLKPSEFLSFLDVLKKSFNYWFELLLKHTKVYCDKKTKDIYCLMFMEEIIYDWPKNFILFLEELSKSPNIYNAHKERLFKFPIKTIKFSVEGGFNLNFYELIVFRYATYNIGLYKKYKIVPFGDNKKILFNFIQKIKDSD